MKKYVRAVGPLSVVLGVSMAGCMAASDSESADQESEEATGTVSSAVGTCPKKASAAMLQQSRASHMLRYIIGGTMPSGFIPSTSACSQVGFWADYWRAKFAQGSSTEAILHRFKDAATQEPTTVCGLTTRPVRFTIWVHDGADNPMSGLVDAMKSCFGTTIEPFVHVNNGRHTCADPDCYTFTTTFDMDPETAQYTASLSTSNGASASAKLLSSGTTTTGWRLPCSTCTPYYKSTIAIGSPCSYGTTLVSSGTKTDFGAVQPRGMTGYRRCANGSLF